VLCSLFENVF